MVLVNGEMAADRAQAPRASKDAYVIILYHDPSRDYFK